METTRQHRGTLLTAATARLGPEASAKLLKEEVDVIYSALLEDVFQRHKGDQYVVDQADAEAALSISDPAAFVSEHQMVAYITAAQLQTEVDPDYAENLNDFLKYARTHQKEKFAIARERLAELVDELLPAGGDEAAGTDPNITIEPSASVAGEAGEANDRELQAILNEPTSVKKITRNILTQDQLRKAIETLVEHNSKFAVHAGDTFDAKESI